MFNRLAIQRKRIAGSCGSRLASGPTIASFGIRAKGADCRVALNDVSANPKGIEALSPAVGRFREAYPGCRHSFSTTLKVVESIGFLIF